MCCHRVGEEIGAPVVLGGGGGNALGKNPGGLVVLI